MKKDLGAAALFLTLAACSPPAQQAAAPQDPAPAAQAAINAPAGVYAIDPHHSSLTFKINHLGISTYEARFTRMNATLNLDPANIAASSITFTVDPSSIRTDFAGDYRGTHPGTPYRSFDEELSKSPNYFNTTQFPEASFRSTSVEVTGANTARVTGDLTLLGQTHPATFDVTYIGSMAAHPFTQRGAIGLSAIGTIERRTWGMTAMLGENGAPDMLGNAITIEFNGAFDQPAPAAPTQN